MSDMFDLGTDYNEKAIIRILLDNPADVFTVHKILTPAMFNNMACAKIVERMHVIATSGNRMPDHLDPQVVLSTFTGHHIQQDVADLLRELTTVSVTPDSLSVHLDMVQEMAFRRGAQALANKILVMTHADQFDRSAIIAKFYSMVGELESGANEKPILSPNVRMEQAVSDLEKRQSGVITDISTGYASLDKMLGGGLAQGTVLTVTAPTGGFKSTFGLSMMRRIAARGKKCLVISPEMPERLMSWKDLSAYTRISVEKFRTPNGLSDDDWAAVMQAANTYSQRNYYTWPYNGTVKEMAAMIAQMKASIGVDVVMVDYLQIVQSQGNKSAYENVSAISGAIRDLSRDLDVAVVLMAQMNRGVYSPTMIPEVSMLKDSGSIENDAYALLALYWPWGVSRLPGKFVPDGHTPLSQSEWMDLGAQSIPFNTDPVPNLTELQVLGLKNRMGTNYAIARLGLEASAHDVFDPMQPGDWLQRLSLEDGFTPLPSLERTEPASVSSLKPFFSSTDAYKATLHHYKMMDDSDGIPLFGQGVQEDQSFLAEVIANVQKDPALMEMSDLI